MVKMNNGDNFRTMKDFLDNLPDKALSENVPDKLLQAEVPKNNFEIIDKIVANIEGNSKKEN